MTVKYRVDPEKHRLLPYLNMMKRKLYENNEDLAIKTGHLEIGLTNTGACNLRCKFCFFPPESQPKVFLPFDSLVNIKDMDPKVIEFSDAGEASLYRDGKHTFDDVVGFLVDLLDPVEFRLVTNGVVIPRGNWQEELNWVRLSINAATRETYQEVCGRDFFQIVMKNMARYLEGPIPNVGASFVYLRDNVEEAAFFVEELYDIASGIEGGLDKLFVRFTPVITKNPDFISTHDQVRKVKKEFEKLKSKGMSKFLKEKTSYHKIVYREGTCTVGAGIVKIPCYLSLGLRVIFADGNIYPCNAPYPDRTVLGNIISYNRDKLARNSLSFNQKNPCYGEQCFFLDQLEEIQGKLLGYSS